ncbi:sulfite exporter TauE/SafE family protein [Xanthobacter flavus]
MRIGHRKNCTLPVKALLFVTIDADREAVEPLFRSFNTVSYYFVHEAGLGCAVLAGGPTMSHQSIPLPPEPAVASDENDAVPSRRPLPAFVGGALIGMLGGLIGLGGAEFRLPLLIGPFRFRALEAVILNKAMSLVVVASALPFRAATVPFDAIAANWPIILNLLAGSLIGAWFGAGWATRLSSRTLYRVLAALLVLIAVALLFGHGSTAASALLSGPWLIVAGVVAGFAIGVVASLMGVAGGELLIPTLVLLFGADIKLAGSLSLAVSLPTMVVAFTRYSRDSAFATVVRNKAFVAVMSVGSIVGTFIGGHLLGLVPDHVLLPILALILVVSSVKVWRHR